MIQCVIGLVYVERHWIEAWFQSLNDLWQTTLVLVAVTILIGAVSTFLTLWDTRRKERSTRSFPYKLLEASRLYEYLGIPEARLEKYITRQQLAELWGNNLFTSSGQVIFHGRSNVGKSREAIELINRMARVRKYRIAYREFSALVPAEASPDLGTSAILFIDDFKLGEGAEIEKGLGDPTARTGQELRYAVEFFRKMCHPLGVVLTMQTPHFEALRSSSEEFVSEFEVVPLQEMQANERLAYAKEMASKLNCEANAEAAYDLLASYEDRPLHHIYFFFDRVVQEGKKQFTVEDVREYQTACREEAGKTFRAHSTEGQLNVLRALSCLKQFEIEATVPLVKHLFFRFYPAGRFFIKQSGEFHRALKYLSHHCLTLVENVIRCPDYPLILKSSDDPSLPDDLLTLTSTMIELAQPGLFRRRQIPFSEAVELLNMITRRLNIYHAPERALEVAALALKLEPNNERALFQTGLTLRTLHASRSEVEKWFQRALKANPTNRYVCHALALSYFRHSEFEKAIALLNSSLKENPKDMLLLDLKLEILCADARKSAEAVGTYAQIQRLLRTTDADISLKTGGELSCARFLAAYTKDPRKKAKRLIRTAQRIRTLIPEASSNNLRIRADAFYTLGCILHDELNESEHAIYFLQLAFSSKTMKKRAARKLYSVYLDRSRENTSHRNDDLKQARSYLEEAILLSPNNLRRRLDLAKLENRSKDWNKVEPESYWAEVESIKGIFKSALVESDVPSSAFHNSVVHQALGSFLWHIERIAYERSLKRPANYETAEGEFRESIGIASNSVDVHQVDVRKHLALTHFTLGEYLFATAGSIRSKKGEAYVHIKKSFEISDGGKMGMSLTSKSSSVECFVGSLFLEKGEWSAARVHLQNAVTVWGENARALWLLGVIADQERDFPTALQYYERSADLQRAPHLFKQIWEKRKHLVECGLLEPNREDDLRLAKKASASKASRRQPNGL